MAPCTRLLSAAIAAGLCACSGPALRVDNPDGHVVFVDGVAATTPVLPFRYYGTTRWDALPADRDGRADFDHAPDSATVAMPFPASPWLFPLDLPLELLDRLMHGRGDATAAVRLPRVPAAPTESAESLDAEVGALTARGRSARLAR